MRKILCQLALLPGRNATTDATARATYHGSSEDPGCREHAYLENATRLTSSPIVIGNLNESTYLESLMHLIDAKMAIRASADPTKLPAQETIEVHSFGISIPMKLLDLPPAMALPHQEITIAIATASITAFETMVSLFYELAPHLGEAHAWNDILNEAIPIPATAKALWTYFVSTCSKAVVRLLLPTSN